MTTHADGLSVAAAAEALGVAAVDLERAIAAAVEEAELPTANLCTLPGPALAVEFVIQGRSLRAERVSEAASAPWRIEMA